MANITTDFIDKAKHSNIFKAYAQRYLALRNDFKSVDILVDEILGHIEIIENIFPNSPSYSKETKELIDIADDVLSLSFSIYTQWREVDSSTIVPKLKLSSLYLRSTIPLLAKNISDTKTLRYKLYNILFSKYNEGLSKYLTKTKSSRDSALAYIILQNKNFNLKIDDKIFLEEIIEHTKESDEIIWEVSFNFKNTTHQALNLIYLIISFLEIYTGTGNIYIRDIYKGSLKSKITAYFKNGDAEKDALKNLEDLKRFKKGKLTKEFEETEKIIREKKLLDIEILQKETELSSEEITKKGELHDIEIERLKLENEKLKIEIEKSKIENFKSKIDLLKELVSDSLLSQEEFEMYINGELFFKKRILSEDQN